MDEKAVRTLTYGIDIYFRAAESVSDIGDALCDELRAGRPSITVDLLERMPGAPPRFGEEWAGYVADSASSLPRENLLLEIWQNHQMMQERFVLLSDEITDPGILEMNSLAVISLTGTVDWPLVGSIWRTFSSLWPSIAYDDVSGLDIDLSDLPEFSRSNG